MDDVSCFISELSMHSLWYEKSMKWYKTPIIKRDSNYFNLMIFKRFLVLMQWDY